YKLHSVFAGVDRNDRVFRRPSQEVEGKRRSLSAEIQQLEKQSNGLAPPEHGFHSRIVKKPDEPKWVLIDLGDAVPIDQVDLVACFDNFAGIGEGFGFPVRFKVEVTDETEFKRDSARLILNKTKTDFPNPGCVPVTIQSDGGLVRLIRVTATRLAERKDDFIFALGEIRAKRGNENVAFRATVTVSDSIPANQRWNRDYLVDGKSFQRASSTLDQKTIRQRVAELKRERDALPKPSLVYSIATDFVERSQFQPTKGSVRPIHALHRGDLKAPGERVFPGAPPLWESAAADFKIPVDDSLKYDEAKARAALAKYVTSANNPLLYRSIVNRIWQWTMGKPIAGTPNDFGRMGMLPTHPKLLDHLAAGLRDDPQQSMKRIVAAIVGTKAYRRSSSAVGFESNLQQDAGNALLWRHDRRRLTAEEIRDATLAVAGKLRLDARGGPSFRDFVIESPQHSPHYQYHLHDVDDADSHRRSVYRFIVRSQPQPMLTTLDCADPSISIARRDESTTPLQALTQWNSRFMTRIAEHMAERLKSERPSDNARIIHACRLAWGRSPKPKELEILASIASESGMKTLCRVLLNSSAMTYVD
ncbi:MAG: DUF1553 domain-containing protein, partial [Planctomycetota bacterium]